MERIGQAQTCSRGASPRRRHCRGDARHQAADTNRSRSRSDREASQSTAGADTHSRDGGDGNETHRAIAPALGAAVSAVFDGRPPMTVTRAARPSREPVGLSRLICRFRGAARVADTHRRQPALSADSPALSIDWMHFWRRRSMAIARQGGRARSRLEGVPRSGGSSRTARSLDAIESERARLSASLLQRGLFDRRAERALSAQTAVLDEALARCRARLDEIESTGQIVAEPTRLAFALLRR